MFRKIKIYSFFLNMSSSALPHFASGTVVKGFGRGSKELGIPTANYPQEVVDNLPDDLDTGVYYGWAQIDSGSVHKMCMSIGWNPFYKNIQKSMETHIMHKFDHDFYGRNLKVCVTGYIRPEQNFDSLDELISVINNDIKISEEKLELEENKKYFTHSFFNTEVNNHR